jgi:hypothetical protein
LWVLRVYILPGTYENILGGKEGVCMFLSLSSRPAVLLGILKNCKSSFGKRVVMLERWEHILSRKTPRPLLASNVLYSQQNDEDKERSGNDSHTLQFITIL